MRQPPPYPIESVDRALRILHLLRDQGSVSVAEIATELNVAPSTAHRLLDMLVYRDFAERDAAHRYAAGPALRVTAAPNAGVANLRKVMQARMESLVARIDETVNLSVRVGVQVRIIAAAETSQPLHVGNQLGSILPAERTSGGLAELAELEWGEVQTLFEDRLTADEMDQLRRRLQKTRRNGFAVNLGWAEPGVYGVGVTVKDAGGRSVAALATAIPAFRFRAERAPEWGRMLRAVAEDAASVIPVA